MTEVQFQPEVKYRTRISKIGYSVEFKIVTRTFVLLYPFLLLLKLHAFKSSQNSFFQSQNVSFIKVAKEASPTGSKKCILVDPNKHLNIGN